MFLHLECELKVNVTTHSCAWFCASIHAINVKFNMQTNTRSISCDDILLNHHRILCQLIVIEDSIIIQSNYSESDIPV